MTTGLLFPVLLQVILRLREVSGESLSEWIAQNSLELTSDETIYWVSIHELPLETDKYVVAYDAYLPNDVALEHTHHILVYECMLPLDGSFDETIKTLTVTAGFKGYRYNPLEKNEISALKYCQQKSLFAWAVGGKMVTFPKDVALKMEKPKGSEKKYLAYEVHIHNPEKHTGITVTNGLKVIYSETPRTYEAGYLVIAYDLRTIVVPPNQNEFIYSGHCGSDCTTEKIPHEGISFFSVQFHAHMSARKVKLRHFRNGEELPWIYFEEHFDFNQQRFQQLDEERKIYPGDHLVVECFYNTTWYKGKAVIGGISSENEMCEAHIWYYPKIDTLSKCASHYNETKSLLEVEFTNFTPGKNAEFPHYSRDDFVDFLNSNVKWTPVLINQLQEWRRFGTQSDQCTADMISPLKHDRFVKYPKIDKEFVRVNVTNNK